MNHTEKIEDINALSQVLNMMRNEINRVHGQADQAREFAPEAAEQAYDKLTTAEEYWQESNERLEQARQALDTFLEYAKLARDAYDAASSNPSAVTEAEAARARSEADRAYVKLETAINRTRSKIQKTDSYINKAHSRVKIALIKAQANEEKEDAKKVRINFTLPENMKEDWQDLASDLSTSVSQMIREAMTLYTSELKNAGSDIERGLTKFGAKMEQVGKKVEDFVDKNVEKRYDPETGELKSLRIKGKEVPINPQIPNIPDLSNFVPRSKSTYSSAVPEPEKEGMDNEQKERLKKRVTGMIRLQKALPIPKLAQSLEVSEEEAENIIYELVAEGIDGSMKGDTFKFNGEIDAVIEAMHAVIDRM